jgi:hypothetical protein
MANIKSLKQSKKWPWTPLSKELLEACSTCERLKEAKKEGGFSEVEFIARLLKMKQSGWLISQRQFNTLKRIHRLRVEGKRVEYKTQDIGKVKYNHE